MLFTCYLGYVLWYCWKDDGDTTSAYNKIKKVMNQTVGIKRSVPVTQEIFQKYEKYEIS